MSKITDKYLVKRLKKLEEIIIDNDEELRWRRREREEMFKDLTAVEENLSRIVSMLKVGEHASDTGTDKLIYFENRWEKYDADDYAFLLRMIEEYGENNED